MKNLTLLYRPARFSLTLTAVVVILALTSFFWSNLIFFLPFLLVLYWGRGVSYVLRWGGVWTFSLTILFVTNSSFFNVFKGYDIGWVEGLAIIAVIAGLLIGRFQPKVPVGEHAQPERFARGNGLQFDRRALDTSKLSEKDQRFFRKELAESYELVRQLKDLRGYLRENFDQTDEVLAFMDGFFQEIIKHPERLTQAGPFLYTDLPNFTQLSIQLINLADNIVKTDEDKQLIRDAPERLQALHEDMRNHYLVFVDEERNALKEQTASEES
jgi:5-bromo-4-chloroindolyl phosphate hydrolysis protein